VQTVEPGRQPLGEDEPPDLLPDLPERAAVGRPGAPAAVLEIQVAAERVAVLAAEAEVQGRRLAVPGDDDRLQEAAGELRAAGAQSLADVVRPVERHSHGAEDARQRLGPRGAKPTHGIVIGGLDAVGPGQLGQLVQRFAHAVPPPAGSPACPFACPMMRRMPASGMPTQSGRLLSS